MSISASHTDCHGVRPIVPLLLLAMPGRARRLAAATNPNLETASVYLNAGKHRDLVTGVTGQNFRTYEECKPQSFQLQKVAQPASVSVLVENSRSSVHCLEDIHAAKRGLLKQDGESHWYAFATFSHESETHSAQVTLLRRRPLLQIRAGKSGGCTWFPSHFNAFPAVILRITQSFVSQYGLVNDSAAREGWQ